MDCAIAPHGSFHCQAKPGQSRAPPRGRGVGPAALSGQENCCGSWDIAGHCQPDAAAWPEQAELSRRPLLLA